MARLKKQGAVKEASQSHLKNGVQLVEALEAPHSLTSAAREGVVSGREVDGELVASSRQRSYGHSRVFLLTFNRRIHNLNGVNLVIFPDIYDCPSMSDVKEHLEATAIDATHLLREDRLDLHTLYCSHSTVSLSSVIVLSFYVQNRHSTVHPNESPKYNAISETAIDWRRKQL